MIVLNTVSHDIRVLKQAKSLKKENYKVSIVGIQDNLSLEYEELEGIEIFRTRVKSVNHKALLSLANNLTKPWKFLCMLIFTLFFFITWYFESLVPFNESLNDFYILIKQLIDKPGLILFMGNFFILFGDIIYKISTRTFRNFYKDLRKNILNINRLFFELHRIKKINPLIQNMLVKINPAIVHCHDLNALIIGAAYKKEKKGQCILVYDSHEIFELTTGSTFVRQIVFSYLQRKLSVKVDGFITINQSIANYLKSKYSNLPKVNIIKNAAVYKKIRNNENMFTKHLNIPEGKKILLFQGGFGAGRGLIKLVMAGKYLKDEWVIVFMGWGKLQTLLQQTANKHGLLNSRIFFCDKVSQEALPYWTASATVGIIPYENTCLNHLYCTPNKLWEYTLAGVPILASPFPEMKKIIDQGVGWLLEDPLNEFNIAKAVNQLTDYDILCAKKKSKEFIKRDNWSKYEARLITLYDSLKPVKSAN